MYYSTEIGRSMVQPENAWRSAWKMTHRVGHSRSSEPTRIDRHGATLYDFLYIYISLFHHKHGSTNNKQYIIKRINTTHTHTHTHTHKKLKFRSNNGPISYCFWDKRRIRKFSRPTRRLFNAPAEGISPGIR